MPDRNTRVLVTGAGGFVVRAKRNGVRSTNGAAKASSKSEPAPAAAAARQ